MIQAEYKDVVFELAKNLSQLDNVQHVILFGSVARNDADKRSDIDMCIIIDNSDKGRISSITLNLEKKYDKNIQLVISKNFEKLDNYFIRQLLNEGILLYGKKPIMKIKNIIGYFSVIYSFSLKNLNQNEKMELKRILYGYSTKKKIKKKMYKSTSAGLLAELHGYAIGRGAILIPMDNVKIIENIFKKFKIMYKKTEIIIPLHSNSGTNK